MTPQIIKSELRQPVSSADYRRIILKFLFAHPELSLEEFAFRIATPLEEIKARCFVEDK